MRLLQIAGEGFRALGTHRLRTFFMMVGTLVGVAALTVVVSMGKGTERKIMERIESFGPRAIMLIAGGGKDLPPPDLSVTTLKLEDADAVRREIDGLEIVSPMAWSFRVDARREANQYQATLWGVEASWHDAWNWYTQEGDGIWDQDVATLARVCVIGQTIKRELFGDAPAIGERIYVNTVSFQVKGVLEPRGASPMAGEDFNNRVIVPITTALRRVLNVDHLGAIRIVTKDPTRMAQQAEAIRALIHDRHHITPPQEDDFRIVTAATIAELARGTSGTLTLLLSALAGLSLVVGGVVLMNILLISVKERTKEIGLRRAVGASQRDVFVQFLAESLTVTLLGMAAGLLIGWGICIVLPRFIPLPIVMSWEPVALAAVAALAVGTFFGIQPARRAARLNPVEALR